MHAIHHSQMERETNSNYSTVFAWWDRLNRSLELGISQAALRIGVPAYTGREDQNFVECLRLPFRAQRDYWRNADGEIPTRASEGAPTVPRTEMME